MKKTNLALALIPFIFSCYAPNAKDRPNIIIILADDMGYADPSCFGNTIVKTPNIDALAEYGLKFTNFYVNSPICSPSRVAINTGCYPMRYSIHSYIASSAENRQRAMADFLEPTAPTLARTLKNNGYITGHFGKWHLGGGRDLGNVPYPAEYGFDKSFVSCEGIGNRILFNGNSLCEQSARLGRGEIVWADKHEATSIYVDSALSFIRTAGDRPFFINLCPNDVHDTHLPAPGTHAKYQSFTENPFEQKFFAVLTELDKQIGRLISELNSMGQLANTIIIFTSDNGPTDRSVYYKRDKYPENYQGKLYPPGSTGDFYGRKWSLYEGGIRMPFIISWKGHIPAGKTDTQTILAAMDLFPSLCSMLQIDFPDNLDGTNKSKALMGTPIQKTEPIMWEYASNPGGSIQPADKNFISPNLAIREGDWKLLINADSTEAKLFNLVWDPGESTSLVETNQEMASVMAARILAWRRTMPVPIRID